MLMNTVSISEKNLFNQGPDLKIHPRLIILEKTNEKPLVRERSIYLSAIDLYIYCEPEEE